jgi:hypothetical protein
VGRGLGELEQAKTRWIQAKQLAAPPITIPDELRQAFTDVGQRLPDVWPTLSLEAQKRLLRTLVRGVNLQRQDDGTLRMRIVWPST